MSPSERSLNVASNPPRTQFWRDFEKLCQLTQEISSSIRSKEVHPLMNEPHLISPPGADYSRETSQRPSGFTPLPSGEGAEGSQSSYTTTNFHQSSGTIENRFQKLSMAEIDDTPGHGWPWSWKHSRTAKSLEKLRVRLGGEKDGSKVARTASDSIPTENAEIADGLEGTIHADNPSLSSPPSFLSLRRVGSSFSLVKSGSGNRRGSVSFEMSFT